MSPSSCEISAGLARATSATLPAKKVQGRYCFSLICLRWEIGAPAFRKLCELNNSDPRKGTFPFRAATFVFALRLIEGLHKHLVEGQVGSS